MTKYVRALTAIASSKKQYCRDEDNLARKVVLSGDLIRFPKYYAPSPNPKKNAATVTALL